MFLNTLQAADILVLVGGEYTSFGENVHTLKCLTERHSQISCDSIEGCKRSAVSVVYTEYENLRKGTSLVRGIAEIHRYDAERA